MKIREEINDRSSDEDKPILLWLFERYHMESQWRFVARCTHIPYGTYSYESHRMWSPTQEGKKLYFYGQMLEAFEKTQDDFSVLVTANKLKGTRTNSGIWEDQLDCRIDSNTMLLKKIKGEK